LSPELIDADHRRVAARVTLGVVVTVITSLILFSGGPKGPWVFAQQTTSPGPGVEFVNPDDNSSNELSWKDDTTGTTYHLVAWVRNAPEGSTVNFSWRTGASGTPNNIGTATRVGTTDTFELFWPAETAPPEGEQVLVATLLSGGTVQATDTETVMVNQRDATPQIDPREAQGETVEITAPANGATLAFTEDPAADVNLKATIQVKHSNGATILTPYFTTSAPGTETAWTACTTGSESNTEAANGVDCGLPAGTNGTSVTGIAVVAGENPGDPVPVTEDDGAADAHRVFGTGASPGPSASTTSPSPTASTTSPSPTSSTTSPSPTASTTSPSPTATTTTPPPPVIYPSTVTLKNKGNKFFGKVKSGHAQCRNGRRLFLKKVTPGKDKTVGKGNSKRNGTYSIAEKNPDGKYYTVARAKQFTTPQGGPVTCDSDKSPKRKA
jgi:hypothetical protein